MNCVSLETFYLLVSVMFIAANCQPPIITASTEYLCLGDLVKLNCSAQGSAQWRSDDILGPGRFISFISSSPPMTVGNGTAVLLETDPRIVTSLSFNLTADRVEISCTDGLIRTTTSVSSVQPSPNNDSPIMDMSVNNNNTVRIVTWEKPSNHENFTLESYVGTLRNSSGDIVDGPTSLPPDTQSIRYDELQTGSYSFNLTVINSCGDVATIIYEFQVSEPVTEVTSESTSEPTSESASSGESGDDSSTTPTWVYVAAAILLMIIIVVVVVVVVVMICFFKGKNKETKGPGLRNSVQMEEK